MLRNETQLLLAYGRSEEGDRHSLLISHVVMGAVHLERPDAVRFVAIVAEAARLLLNRSAT